MHAVENNRIDCVKLLLCEAKLQNNAGETALMIAVQQGYSEIVRILADYESCI